MALAFLFYLCPRDASNRKNYFNDNNDVTFRFIQKIKMDKYLRIMSFTLFSQRNIIHVIKRVRLKLKSLNQDMLNNSSNRKEVIFYPPS